MSPEQALGQPERRRPQPTCTAWAPCCSSCSPARRRSRATDSQEIVGRHIREPVPVGQPLPRQRSALALGHRAPLPGQASGRSLSRRLAPLLEALRAGRAGAAADPVSLLPRADESPTETMPVAKGRAAPRPWMAGAAAAARVGAVLVFSGVVMRTAREAMGRPARPPTPRRDRRGQPRRPGRPLVVENRLAEPIALSVDDTSLTIRPGDQGRLRLPNQGRLEASWAMVQPTEGDRMLGERVEGAIVAEQVEGEIRRGDRRRVGRAGAVRADGGEPGGPTAACRRSGPDRQCGLRLPRRHRRFPAAGLLPLHRRHRAAGDRQSRLESCAHRSRRPARPGQRSGGRPGEPRRPSAACGDDRAGAEDPSISPIPSGATRWAPFLPVAIGGAPHACRSCFCRSPSPLRRWSICTSAEPGSALPTAWPRRCAWRSGSACAPCPGCRRWSSGCRGAEPGRRVGADPSAFRGRQADGRGDAGRGRAPRSGDG